MRLLLASILLTAASALAPPAALGATCPESCLDSSCSTAPARDSAVTFVCEPYASSQGRMTYDLATGRLYAEARGCTGWYGPGGGAVDVRASDRYRLVGPAGGGPVAFEARLALHGGVGGGMGTCGGSVAETGGAWAAASDAGTGFLDQVVAIPLVHAVGDEFRIDCHASGSAGGAGGLGFVEAQLSFAGLPEGVGVTSCQGYAGIGAVPARPANWGSLKLRYR